MSVRSLSLRRRVFVITVLAFFGFSSTVLLFLQAREWEREQVQAEFHRLAQERYELVRGALHDGVHAIKALQSLYASSEVVERTEFRTFVEHLFFHSPGTQALGWIPRVKYAERKRWERLAQSQGLTDFTFTEQTKDRAIVPASAREEYFPVFYVEPQEANEDVLGFDQVSHPERRAALIKARDTGGMVATRRIKLVQDGGEPFGFLIVLPIYRNNRTVNTVRDREEDLEAFVLEVFRIQDLVEASLRHTEPSGIDLYLIDNDAKGNDRLLYFRQSRLAASPNRQPASETELSSGLHFMRPIAVADRTWLIYGRPSEGYFVTGTAIEPWMIFSGGVVLTSLLCLSSWLVLAGFAFSQASLREKETLLREIHHRVKNNMQIIVSLLKLQSDSTKRAEDIEMLRDARNRVQSMALVHELLYGSRDLSSIECSDFIGRLVDSISRAYGTDASRVQVKTETDKVSLTLDTAVPMGLLINELVSNALVHAFPQGAEGVITVRLRKTDVHLELVVADSGIGLPETMDIRRVDSLGLQLIVSLAERQLRGRIMLDRSQGTEFRITFGEISADHRRHI